MLCYFNSGLSFRAVADDYTAETGEVLFSSEPTTAELTTAFSGYADAVKEAKIDVLDAEYESQFTTLAQSYATALMAGDTTTTASVQEDYTALKTEYQTALEAIE